MKIAVCIKHVPARDSRLRIAADGRWIEERDLSWEINEPDTYALEEALRLREKGAAVSYNDPFFPTVGHGRHYALNMTNTPLENLGQYDAVMIVTDHTSYDYKAIVEQAKLVVDTRNATKGIVSEKILHC